MTTILHVASSSNLNGFTRQVGTALIESLQRANPGAKIITRDLIANPLPHINPEFVSVLFNGDNSLPALALSESLVAEVLAADILVVEAPMYNFGIPSALKAWIDHVIRKGRTFNYDGGAPVGLTKIKKAYIVTSSGGIYSDGAMKSFDHTDTHVQSVLNFIGITDIETIRTEGIAYGPDKATEALEAAKAKVAALSLAA